MVESGEHSTCVQGAHWPMPLYQCALPHIHSTILVSYGQQRISLEVSNEGEKWWVNGEGLLAQNATAATLSVLTSELDSCQQLLQEEPSNKWCLLTTMLLMQSLDPAQYSAQIKEKAHELMTVDPYRRSYYSDLLSQFVMKEVLRESLPALGRSRVLDLTGRGLSRLNHTEYLVAYHTLLLSNNQLSTLPDEMLLPALHTLSLDDNSLETLPSSIADMEALKVLSVKNNKISSLCSLESCLVELSGLRVLHLQGNPVCQDTSLTQALKKLLPNLTELKITD